MRKKIKVGVLFGGKSAEHEVSLLSARNVIGALDRKKYEVVPIGISKAGKWVLGETSHRVFRNKDQKRQTQGREVSLVAQSSGTLVGAHNRENYGKLDVVFPVLHGPYGEDGSIQGLLKLAGVPFVGPDVLGSAVGMDKDVAKRLLRDAGIPVAKFLVFRREDVRPNFEKLKRALGIPLFVKPANLGSSVGVSKVRTAREFVRAMRDAFAYDNKILVEEYIRGREIECAVLGNEHPAASVPGEIIPHHEFYSYEAKYLDENGAALKIPAKLPRSTVKNVQQLAVQTFRTLSCEGMARVDFFLTPRGKLYVNEINTIPGFTNISMYPKLWEVSGISYSRLIDKLIRLALARHRRDRKLKTSR
ncbi:MAG: D-alanine--D-alanine ligase [Patescibacteria group bacterium]